MFSGFVWRSCIKDLYRIVDFKPVGVPTQVELTSSEGESKKRSVMAWASIELINDESIINFVALGSDGKPIVGDRNWEVVEYMYGN